jgi:DDE superfamily endonuclease
VVTVRGGGTGKVSIAGVACYRPGDRPHLFYKLLVHHRRKGEAKSFAWSEYRDLIIAAHRELAAPVIWCWDNLNVHLAPELADFAAENEAWLRVYRMPAYASELNPAEMWLSQCGLRRSSMSRGAAFPQLRVLNPGPSTPVAWLHLILDGSASVDP